MRILNVIPTSIVFKESENDMLGKTYDNFFWKQSKLCTRYFTHYTLYILYNIHPVKNVTGFPWKFFAFSVTNRWMFGPNGHQFHDYSMPFVQVLFVFHAGT